VEDLIKEAKERAEAFLFEEVEKISIGIANKEKRILFPPSEDPIAVRFEAHAYLAHKYKKLKSKYVEELRNLWLY
jgi:hypothetical protein